MTELEEVVEAYTTIATAVVPKDKYLSATFPTIAPNAMRKMTGKTHVPVLSVVVPKRPDCDYSGLPCVARVRPGIRIIASAMTLPKQITVEDTQGKV